MCGQLVTNYWWTRCLLNVIVVDIKNRHLHY